MGNQKTINYDINNLLNVSKKLKNVNIHFGSYEKILPKIDNKTFVYLDPPYRDISKNSSFKKYTKYDFTEQNQIELFEFCKKIDKIGAKFLLSNSDPHNFNKEDMFFDKLYKDFNINRITIQRNISGKAENRGLQIELLISNIKI